MRLWRRRWGSPWLLLVGTGLLLALAAVALVQYRQVQMLSSQVRYEGDNLVWSFVQLESEAMQLRDLLREQLRYPAQPLHQALRLRYELFASRLPLVDPQRTLRIADLGQTHAPTFTRLTALVQRFDPVFAEPQTGPLPLVQVDALLQALQALQEPVHDLSMRANQAVAEQVGLRNDTVREQSRLSVGLTVFQSLLTLAFAGITAQQFSSLQRRRREQERLAQQFQQARLEAERANQSKTQFLANMSHELRTPLNGMLGMLWLLQRSPLNEQQADHLRTAHESATHLLALVNDILDISRLESGRVDIVTAPVSLRGLLDEVRALMAVGAQAKGLQLEVGQDDGLPDWVMADEQRLRQILFNLVSNALKFCEQGQVSLRLRADPAASGASAGVGLRFVVRDSGIGIDPATMALLFKRFTQGDASSARRYGGTGLGLEISRNLARLMGGDIEVSSSAGQGAEFTLRLVLAEATEPPPPALVPAALPAAPPVADHSLPALPSLDLLVVDDNATNRKFMAALLGAMGHRVRLAEDGAQAVTAVQQQPPDLVLMDLHMPVQDGEQATRALRALPPPANALPVVALTADAYAQTRDRVLAAGMNGYLSKPVQVDELEHLLHRFFGPSGQAGPAPANAVAMAAPVPPLPPPAPPAAMPAPGPRPSAAELAQQLDMDTLGRLCLSVGLANARQLLQDFYADAQGRRAGLLAALDRADAGTLKAQAHALKGAAANLGLRALQQQAHRLEAASVDSLDGPACSAQAQALRDAIGRSQAVLLRMGLL